METDRSRIISYQRCPRERFLAYHHLGGLQRTRKSLPLQFGSAFHEGAQVLLTPSDDPPLTPSGMADAAVLQAHWFLQDQFANAAVAFDGEQPTDVAAAMAYGREEQLALAEALLRAWWVHEGAAFLEQFEVIEVEREGRATLHHQWWADIVLMFRPDALVRERASGDLYVVSWKTCATFGKRNVDQARHDMQSMSEVWGVEETYPNDYETQATIEGVLYKWIIKGRRSLDKWDNLYKQNSPLIYGWVKRGDTPEMDEWSWSYEFEKEDGSGVSRLGKGWRKVPIWREYEGGIRGWIEDLHRQSIFPRHLSALEATFPVSTPVERRVDEVESWKRQVVAQEQQIGIALQELSQYPTPPVELVDELFPQYTHSCHSYSGCQFLPICWEGAPAEPGELYQIRSANHPEKGDEND